MQRRARSPALELRGLVDFCLQSFSGWRRSRCVWCWSRKWRRRIRRRIQSIAQGRNRCLNNIGPDDDAKPQRDIHFTATFVRAYAQAWEKLDRLRQQVEAGVLTLRLAAVYPPERAADAHRRLEAGGTRGRLVIQF